MGAARSVEVLDIHTQGWDRTGVVPGFGLLPDEFGDAYLRIFGLSHGDVAWFREDIAIPLAPYFAVQVEGALFSCGDAHAAQGDGEVCVTAIEVPMFAALRFTLDKDRSIPAPQFSTHGPLTPQVDTAPFYGTTGVNADLYVAAQDAVRAMIEHLGRPTASAPRTHTCSAASSSTSRSPRSSTAASTSSAPCFPRRSSADRHHGRLSRPRPHRRSSRIARGGDPACPRG